MRLADVRETENAMTKLERLYSYYGQSLWLDNLTRAYLRDGTLARVVANACPSTPQARYCTLCQHFLATQQ